MVVCTGGRCAQPGIYRNVCHAKEIALGNGESFPLCSLCHRTTSWILVRARH
jgi:hypothetical protein